MALISAVDWDWVVLGTVGLLDEQVSTERDRPGAGHTEYALSAVPFLAMDWEVLRRPVGLPDEQALMEHDMPGAGYMDYVPLAVVGQTGEAGTEP